MKHLMWQAGLWPNQEALHFTDVCLIHALANAKKVFIRRGHSRMVWLPAWRCSNLHPDPAVLLDLQQQWAAPSPVSDKCPGLFCLLWRVCGYKHHIWVLNSLLSLVFLKIILYWQLRWSRMAGEQWEVLLPITGSDCTLGSLISLLKSVINIGPLFFVPNIFCWQLDQNWWPVTSCQHCTKWMCCVKCHSFEKDSKKA